MAKRTRERTPFGERLVQARKHAKMSQAALAQAVGLAQSTLAEAEYTANGSAKTTQIAAETKVSAKWLASGNGQMVLPEQSSSADSPSTGGPQKIAAAPTPLNPSLNIYQVISALGQLLSQQDLLTRLSVAPLLQRLAQHPSETDEIARQIQRSVVGGKPGSARVFTFPARTR